MAVHGERDFEDGEYKARPGPVRDAPSKRFSSLAIPLSSIAVLGDMDNDLAMLRKAGLSIAMGNASTEVKQQSDYVTASNADDGFALAIERFILNSSGEAASFPQRGDIGGEIGRIRSREPHIRHLGMRVEQEISEPVLVEAGPARDGLKGRRLSGDLSLIGRHDMAA